MRQVSLREANQNFSACIAEVESGEHLILLRRGKPVAEIIPYSAEKPLDPKREAARQRMIELMREGIDLGGVSPTRDEMHEP
jgi:prevent-host-death family protein